MRIFKTTTFTNWAKKSNVTDKMIIKAVEEMNNGLITAKLGGGLCKQRIARPGSGKSNGHRVLVSFSKDKRSVFVFGFSKNDRENIDKIARDSYSLYSQIYLNLSEKEINNLIKEKKLIEVKS